MNIKEQLAAKIETVNTVIKFVDDLNKDKNSLDLLDVRTYLVSMKNNYKDTFEFITKTRKSTTEAK